MRMIFVNLPVKDLDASKRFFAELGFGFDPQFTDQSAACMSIAENIYVMLLVENRFRDFINGEIADAEASTEVLIALSVDHRGEVDQTVEKRSSTWRKPRSRRRGARRTKATTRDEKEQAWDSRWSTSR